LTAPHRLAFRRPETRNDIIMKRAGPDKDSLFLDHGRHLMGLFKIGKAELQDKKLNVRDPYFGL